MSRAHSLRPWAAALLLALCCWAVYGQTLDDEWHFDDLAELRWPGVRDMAPRVSHAHYRGVVPLWLWAWNHRLTGEDVRGYHALNIALHWGNALLVMWSAWLLTGLFARREGTSGKRGPPGGPDALGALAAGLVFCVHPVATQSVAYLTQRSTSATSLFFLLALASYCRLRLGTRGAWRAALLLLLGLVSYQTCLHSKHLALMLPAVLVTLELLLRARGSRIPRSNMALGLAFVALLVWRVRDFAARFAPVVLGGVRSLGTGGGPPAPELGGTSVSPGTYLLTQLPVIATYVRLLFWPAHQNLDVDFAPATSLAEPRVLLSAVLLAGLVALVVLLRKRDPLTAFGIALFFLTLVPTSSLVPRNDFLMEHRVYLPSVGFAWAVGSVVRRAAARSPRRALALRWLPAGIALAALAFVAHERAAVWATEVTLWEDTVRKSPAKVRPRVNLALAYQSRGRTEEAIVQYEEALRLRPDHAIAHNNLGNIHRQRGDLDTAERHLRAAIRSDARYTEAHLNLGNIRYDRGDFAAAESLYAHAAELDPDMDFAWYNLAKARQAFGRLDAAIEAFARAVEARPDNAQALNDLGCLYLEVGRLPEARDTLDRAAGLRADWAVPRFNLGLVHRALGDPEEAGRQFRAAVSLDPALAESVPPTGTGS